MPWAPWVLFSPSGVKDVNDEGGGWKKELVVSIEVEGKVDISPISSVRLSMIPKIFNYFPPA